VTRPTVLELFAGIGGLSLGLERAGFHVVGQVEINPFARSILTKHWPEVPKHDDVKTALAWWLSEPRPRVDCVAGGYPCQPDSNAGMRKGTDDDRWLWPEFARVVHGLQRAQGDGPRYVIGENVGGHITGGLRFVLRDLERLGYTARAGTIRACEVGAPHPRSRVFVVADSNSLDGPAGVGSGEGRPVRGGDGSPRTWPDPTDWILAATSGDRGVADGLPRGVDVARVTALGNAVVPAVGDHIGRLVLSGAWRDV
jgi:DNA (cytosine-5)-methyltransferase 1